MILCARLTTFLKTFDNQWQDQRKIGLDYFPFDVDFFEDEKIVCIAGGVRDKG